MIRKGYLNGEFSREHDMTSDANVYKLCSYKFKELYSLDLFDVIL